VCYSQTLRRSTLVITIKIERQPSFHIKFTCLEKFRERQNAVSCKNFTASVASLDKERLFSEKLIGFGSIINTRNFPYSFGAT